MNFFVTIPNYCEKGHQLWMLNKCLESLFDVEPKMAGKVLIVDDLSKVDIMPVVSKYPVKLIRHREKSSYSKMINSSIKAAKLLGGDSLITVNNDIEHQSTFINKLENIFEKDPLIDVIGALLFYPDGRTQHSGVTIGEFAGGPWCYDDYRTKNSFSDSRYIHHVTGAWQAIKLNRNGLLYDERFPFAYEDVDFCLRTWEKGNRVYFENSIYHIHHESVTRSNRVTEREIVGSVIFRNNKYLLGEIDRMVNEANHQAKSS